MRCNKCGSEWNSKTIMKISECPFCGASLIPLNEKGSVEETLRWLVQDRGQEIFLNTAIINSILADLVHEDEKGRNRIKLALTSGAGKDFYELLKQCDNAPNMEQVVLFKKKLMNNFAEDFSAFVSNCFFYAVSAIQEFPAEVEKNTNIDDSKIINTQTDEGTRETEKNRSAEKKDGSKAYSSTSKTYNILERCSSRYAYNNLLSLRNGKSMADYYLAITRSFNNYYFNDDDINIPVTIDGREFWYKDFFDCRRYSVSFEEAKIATIAAFYDWPLAYFAYTYTVVGNAERKLSLYAVDDAFRLGSTRKKYSKLINDAILEIANSIPSGLSGQKTAQAVYDMICSMSKYDKKMGNCGYIDVYSHSVASYAEKKMAVCEGFAKTFQAIMLYLGYECLTVGGYVYSAPNTHSERHAWNLVKIDSSWHVVDITAGINGYKSVFKNNPEIYREYEENDRPFDLYRYQFRHPQVVNDERPEVKEQSQKVSAREDIDNENIEINNNKKEIEGISNEVPFKLVDLEIRRKELLARKKELEDKLRAAGIDPENIERTNKDPDDELTDIERKRINKTIEYSDGTIYEGETVNEKPDGFGKMKFSDGNLYEGNYSNGKRAGRGKFTWESGAYYDGNWSEDLREDSNGYQKFADGSIYKGGWKAGVRSGYGVLTDKNNNNYAGQWKDNKKSGKGIMKFTNGFIYDGAWLEDTPTGYGKFSAFDSAFSEFTISGYWERGWSKGDKYILYVKTNKGEIFEYQGSVSGYKLSGAGILYCYEGNRKEPIGSGKWVRGKKTGASSRIEKEAEEQFETALNCLKKFIEDWVY